MSEQTGVTTTTEELNDERGKPAESKFEAITSQDDFDKAIQARLARERAKFADYDSLKDQAAKFAAYEDAQKTEAQKQQEALEKAQRELAELTVAKTRAEVAAAKGVPAELLSGGTQEELEASADALIAFRGEQSAPTPSGPVVPGEGQSTPTGGLSQLTAEDIKTMTAEEVNVARRAGRLNKLLGIS